MSMMEASDELSRLRIECSAKDETLHQLKLKTKAFVDNMRQELNAEKAKVAKLEEQLQQSPSGFTVQNDQGVEELKKELSQVCARERELRSRAKAFADTMRNQLQSEKDKSAALERELDNLKENDRVTRLSQVADTQYEQVVSKNREFEEIISTQEREIVRLQAEMESWKRNAVSSSHNESEESDLRSRLEHVTHQYQQHKIENEHLQKQLLDKDFQLEQFHAYRAKAEEEELRTMQAETECQTVQQQLMQANEEIRKLSCSSTCSECSILQTQLADLTRAKDEIERTLVQCRSALEEQRKNLPSTMEEMEALRQRNTELVDQLQTKEIQINNLSKDLTTMEEHLDDLKNQMDIQQLQHRKTNEQEEQRLEQELEQLRRKHVSLEKGYAALQTSMETLKRDEMAKRQKAKSLVLALSSEKQALVETKQEQQQEIDRLRTELNQKNVENDRRLKIMNEESHQKLLQSSANAHHLADEIQILKQTLSVLQESERSQQRAKELADARREVEDSNKKRLAAKAETQKIAIELEKTQKAAQQSNEVIMTRCDACSKDLDSLADHVQEVLQVLQKRTRASSNDAKQNEEEITKPIKSHDKSEPLDELRGPELTCSTYRSPASNQCSGRNKSAEGSVFELQKQIAFIVDLTDHLCDLSSDQNDISLRDVLRDRMAQFIGQCFAEKVRQTYAKVDESETSRHVASPFGSDKIAVDSSSPT